MFRHCLLFWCCILLACPASAGQGARVRLSAPPVVQALPLLRAASGGDLRPADYAPEFLPWRSPEQLRALVASQGVDAVITTLPTAAVLAGKGVPCKVLAVYCAPLWIVSASASSAPPGSPASAAPPATPATLAPVFQSLAGREILLPFGPGDMPELILAVLAQQGGVTFASRHSGSALEAANLLRTGRGQYALLAEPAASWLVRKEQPRTGPQAVRLRKLLNLGALWPEVFPGQEAMPTAALVMVGRLANDPAACAAVRGAYVRGWAWAVEHPDRGADLARRAYPALGRQLAVPGVARELLRTSELLTGGRAKQAARFFLERVQALSPASVGGRLPDAGFWGVGDAQR